MSHTTHTTQTAQSSHTYKRVTHVKVTRINESHHKYNTDSPIATSTQYLRAIDGQWVTGSWLSS